MTSDKAKIYIAGHNGMVGSAVLRELIGSGYSANNIITKERRELDLTNQAQVTDFFFKYKPSQVYLAAAKVGGIKSNSDYPAEFIYENLMIEANVIHAAFCSGVKKLLFLGSSCIYPRQASQPIAEEALLTGPLEPTNEPYAIAKIAGLKMCESYNRQYGQSHGLDFRSLMPTNLYGPRDNYHRENSHVIPGMIRRFHEAKSIGSPEVKIWGTGKARREFLFVDDFARAIAHFMDMSRENYNQYNAKSINHINVGSGEEISINNLASLIANVVGYSGLISFDDSKPDGTPRKLLNSEFINSIGWRPEIGLKEGLMLTYEDFKKRIKNL